MAYQTIIFEKADHIATITLNRPDRLNALIQSMAEEVLDVIRKADKEDDIRVLVITGAGRAFCSGGDVKEFAAAFQQSQKLGEQVTSVDQRLLELIPQGLRDLEKPVIASINGPAVGWGCSLSLACDIRIMADSASIGAIFLRIGLVPESGTSYNLVRLVGLAKACELVFNAKIVDAQEAERIGLVNMVVPASRLKEATLEMARNIASGPPLAMRLAKKLLYHGMDGDLLGQLHEETLSNHYLRDTKDYAEGTQAFMEKRKAVFQGK